MSAARRAALALAAVLALGACQDNEEPTAAAEPAVPELYPGETDDDVTVTGTLAVVESGLAGLPVSTALDYITAWETQLGGGRVAGGGEIAGTLGELRALLERGGYRGSEVGPVLVRLGEQTERAAAQAEGDAQRQVRQLGRALAEAGRMMGGAGVVAAR